MKVFKVINKKGTILAQGTVFKDNTCAVRIFYCKSPMLIQNKFNKEEVLGYVYCNVDQRKRETGFQYVKIL